jgi:hypothetical protein
MMPANLFCCCDGTTAAVKNGGGSGKTFFLLTALYLSLPRLKTRAISERGAVRDEQKVREQATLECLHLSDECSGRREEKKVAAITSSHAMARERQTEAQPEWCRNDGLDPSLKRWGINHCL